ncbi:hypothetical protein FSP39_003394 [Pinctada imbricata]|uniref:Uncharacterized protein n=1 Tax=Pinctada imbricata TaxID=66713 RepID=A0AA88YUM4_PINIB|nr:hypothetical protein FSP39_003394 [Pinctada imbricata]
MQGIQFNELDELKYIDQHWQLDMMSSIIWSLRSPVPAWSGFMQMIHKSSHPGKSSMIFFPMIDMEPGDMSCVYSTLKFLCNEARKYSKCPIITFDQPLYWKALLIIRNEPEDASFGKIILRLGGFHLEMSFLGAIGHIMAGSGLEELLETVYAPNAVKHMLSGKAVSRALRGHFLVESALNSLIIQKVFTCEEIVTGDAHPLPRHEKHVRCDNEEEIVASDNDARSRNEKQPTYDNEEDILTDDAGLCATNEEQNDDENTHEILVDDARPCTTDEEQTDEEILTDEVVPRIRNDEQTNENKEVEKIIDRSFVTKDADLLGILEAFDGLKDKTLKISDVIEDKVFERVQCRISDYKDSLVDCKTANLWLTYLEMVVLLHRFVRAERTGDWLLHLDTVQRMLPYFAASGHNLYLKSAYIYLSDMLKMRTSHPDIYASFLSGQHVVRRTDRYWAGIWTDLTIEQVLMKSLKSSGGLTRGRGMSEFQRAVWILSSPVCAEFSLAMQNLTGIQYSSSEQHKDSYAPRQARNAKDMKTLSDFLQERDPFQADMKELRNIDNGVTADANVNVDHCLEVGQKIVKSLAGQDAMTHVFKRKHQATTLATKTSVKVDDELISVDPQLMFQRLTTIARETSPDLSEIFKYELSNVPPALFDNSGLAREAHKSQLADAIWTDRDCGTDSLQSCRLFVLDGGSLLHRLSWPQKSTFGEIVQMYTQYVLNKFTNPCVVFDGYESAPSTKDMTHVRRCKGVESRKTVFNESTVCIKERGIPR